MSELNKSDRDEFFISEGIPSTPFIDIYEWILESGLMAKIYDTLIAAQHGFKQGRGATDLIIS